MGNETVADGNLVTGETLVQGTQDRMPVREDPAEPVLSDVAEPKAAEPKAVEAQPAPKAEPEPKHDDKLQERFSKTGARLIGDSPHEFAARIRAERAQWGEIIKAANIAPQ